MGELEQVHPGGIFEQDFMQPFGLSSNAFARVIRVTPARVNEIARARRSIAADTALGLARYSGTDAHSWMNLQDDYDLKVTEREAGDAIRAIHPMRAA